MQPREAGKQFRLPGAARARIQFLSLRAGAEGLLSMSGFARFRVCLKRFRSGPLYELSCKSFEPCAYRIPVYIRVQAFLLFSISGNSGTVIYTGYILF